MAMPFDTSVVCPVFIGRTEALASFERVFEQVKHGQGHTVLVCGEAGIGKSRLVAEVRARCEQAAHTVLQGACFEQDRVLPFAPLLDVLRTLLVSPARDATLRRLSPFAPELINLLPDLAIFLPDVTPTPLLSPEQEKRRLFVVLTSFVLAQADQGPVLLVIEDLHWSDDTSLEFLRGLTRHLGARPLLLLLTYRGEEVHPALARFLSALNRERAALECSLTALSQEEVHAMLRAMFQLKKPVRRDFLEALYELTEGNPFFVEEVVKSLLASGEIFFTEGSWDRKPLAELHIPRSVSDAVQQRTSLLREVDRETLALAAVVGRQVEVALLQAVTGRPEAELLAAMDTLIAAQLLVETSAGHVAFRHALTRAAVYTGLPASRRKALHLTLARTLERLWASSHDAHLAELAYHFYQAEAWTQALEYGQRVGEKALALYAPRAALDHFTHALEAASHQPASNPIPLYRARGQAHDLLGHFEAARSDFEQAVEAASAAGNRQEEWQSLMAFGVVWLNRVEPLVGDILQRALDLTQALADPQKAARSRTLLAAWLVYTGQPEAGIQMLEEALALLQQQGDRRGVAQALALLGQVTEFHGDVRRSVSYYDRAIALLRAVGDQRLLVSSLAFRSCATSPALHEAVLGVAGTLAACQQDLEEALRLADSIEWREGQAVAHVNAGWVLASYGVVGEGLTHARAALELATEIENRQRIASSYYVLGEAHLMRLDPGEAMAALEAGLAMARTLGVAYWMEHIVATLAQAYLLAGDLPRAEAVLAEAISAEQAPRNVPERRLAWAWGELALAQHRPEMALRLADGLIASAPGETQRAEGQPIPALLKLRGEALFALGRTDEAISALEEARRGAQEQGALPLLWQIQRSLGRVYAASQQKQRSRHACAAAREVIAGLAASLDDAAQRDRFVSAALASLPKEPPLTSRQAAKEAFDGLSEREREIALLIAQGRSNREIAAALVISQRTVGTHIRHLYAKLGLGTRVQLVAWVVEKGGARPFTR